MTNFLLQIDLATRLVMRRRLTTGDGLLAGLLYSRYAADYERAIADLPIQTIEGVPQMSVMLPYSAASRTVESVTIIRNVMRDMDHNPDMAVVLDKMPSASMLNPSEGPLSSLSNTYETYDIPHIYFIGCGDMDAVLAIAIEASSIGPQRNRGYGQVAGVSIRPVETDNPWFGIIGKRDDRNIVLRPIPARLRDKLPSDLVCTESNETWHNPYFPGFPSAVVEPCLMPLFPSGMSFHEEEIHQDLAHLV